MRTWRGKENNVMIRQMGGWPVIGQALTNPVRLAAAFKLLVVLVALMSMTACGEGSGDSEAADNERFDTTTNLSHLVEDEIFFAQTSSFATPAGETSSHDFDIRLEDGEPVKEIALRQVLLVDSSSTSGELEIRGSSGTNADGSSRSGKIRICNLLFLDVEAEHFEVHNTDVVLMDMVNVSTENDLGIEITPVNTVRCGRGGTTVLSLGEEIPEEEEQIELGEGGRTVSVVTSSGRQGLRATQIRILGPSGGTGYIENLIIERTSVFGRIKLQDLEIQRLFMRNVTVESNSAESSPL